MARKRATRSGSILLLRKDSGARYISTDCLVAAVMVCGLRASSIYVTPQCWRTRAKEIARRRKRVRSEKATYGTLFVQCLMVTRSGLPTSCQPCGLSWWFQRTVEGTCSRLYAVHTAAQATACRPQRMFAWLKLCWVPGLAQPASSRSTQLRELPSDLGETNPAVHADNIWHLKGSSLTICFGSNHTLSRQSNKQINTNFDEERRNEPACARFPDHPVRHLR